MKLRPAQQAAVEHAQGNLLVVASAGTGKTTVLTQRCIYLLTQMEPPCRIDELLVVTFTRAAAAELKSRLSEALRDQIASTRDPRLREHLRQQQALLDAADIGTIDSWAGRLVRQHFDLLDIDPGFVVLSEQDAGLLAEDVLDALLEATWSTGGPLADKLRAWLLAERSRSDQRLRQLVRALHALRDNLLDPDTWLAAQRAFWSQPPASLRSSLRARIARAIRAECAMQIEQLDAWLAGGDADALVAVLSRYRERLETLRSSLADPQAVERLSFDRMFPTIRRSQIGDPIADRLEQIKKRWFSKRLKEPWADLPGLLDAAEPIGQRIVTLIDLEQRFHDRLLEEKRRRGALEFGDVLRLALGLLGQRNPDGTYAPSAIAERLRQQYRHVLVDEYQDTSPVQVELLRLVSRDAGNRFLVGDVKQSIYGFRQAEPGLFVELVRAVQTGRIPGQVQALGENFRSHGAVLEPLNAIFERLFEPDFGGSDYGPQERLTACRPEPANPTLDGHPRVELALFEPPQPPTRNRGHANHDDEAAEEQPAGGGLDDLERIEREATWAALRIRELLASGTRVPEYRPDGHVHLRPLEPGDIVILLRSARQNAPLAAARLRELGIPAVVLGRESMFDCPEVQDALTILRLIANLRQDIPLAAYLRSPAVGLSDDELLTIRRAARGPFFHAVLRFGRNDEPTTESLRRRLRTALDRLVHWRRRARHLELPALLREILRDTGLPLVAAARPPAEYRVAMLRALEFLAAEFRAGGREGVREFVDFIDRLEDQELLPAVTASLRSDVVRIMTIHAAKGLEFPVVFLLNTGARFEARGPQHPLLADVDEGLAFDSDDVPAGRRWISPCKPLIHAARRMRERAEELRLLYVACTRARELLLIAGHLDADTREQIRQRFSPSTGRISLFDRLSAQSIAEWLLAAIHAGGLDAPTSPAPVRLIEDPPLDGASAPPRPAQTQRETRSPTPPLSEADQAWLERAWRQITQPPDTKLSHIPAAISVSELKHRAAFQAGADRPETGIEVDTRGRAAAPVRLPRPRFAQAITTGGTDIGTAYHRFLQFADLARLDAPRDVHRQIEQLCAAARLSAADAAAIDTDDIVWFARSALGRRVAGHAQALIREQPFVYGRDVGIDGEWTLLRGVIDLLWREPEGWCLIDFKTDRPRRSDDWKQRLRIYRAQLSAYAEAITAITSERVAGCWLVFLRARRIEPV